MSRPSLSNETGFTLIELMVVIVVATILLLLAIPSFADMIDRARLKGAAGDAVSLIAEARGGAVKHNRDVVVTFGDTAPAWCIGANEALDPSPLGTATPAAVACTCTTPSGCMVGGQELAMSSGKYSDVTLNSRPADLTFDGRLGTLRPLAASSVILTSPKGKYQMQLTIAPLGQASLCIPAGQPNIVGYSSCP